MSEIRIAIIGTAGRDLELKLVNSQRFKSMIDQVKNYVTQELKHDLKDVILVSGGSSFSDHVAVALFLQCKFQGLHLYMPCKFDPLLKQFANCATGICLQDLHLKTSQLMNQDSLEDLKNVYLQKSTNKNVVINEYNGFLARNLLIAQNCDYMIAFTPNNCEPSSKSGTGHTWNKCKLGLEKRKHFDLRKL